MEDTQASHMIGLVIAAFKRQDGISFAAALVVYPRDPGFSEIQQELLLNTEALLHICNDAPDPLLADFLAALLSYIREINDSSDDVGTALRTFHAMEELYEGALSIFQNTDSPWFAPVIRKLSTALSQVAFWADFKLRNENRIYTERAQALLNKALPLILRRRGTGGELPRKNDAFLCIINISLRCYFSVVTNFGNIEPFLLQFKPYLRDISAFPREDRLVYQYWMGRLALFDHRAVEAHLAMAEAFRLCPDANQYNKCHILKYLIVATLPFGVVPKRSLLKEYGLSQQFVPVIRAMQLGDWRRFAHSLDSYASWYRSKGLYTFLLECCLPFIWRCLIRRCLRIRRALPGSPMTSEPKISLAELCTAFRISSDDSTFSLADTECVCANLIAMGYVNGYVLHSKGILVLQKGPHMGFPPVNLSVIAVADGREED